MRAAFGLGLVAAALAVAEPSSRPSGASAVEQRTFKLHHRFLPPSTSSVGSTQPEWTEFASFPAGPSSTLSETAAVTHLDTTVNGGTEIKGDAEGWYQVGVETDGGWVTGSTRACYLEESDPATIVVHMTGDTPTSLFVLPPGGVPASGDCPVQARDRSVALSGLYSRAGKGVKVVLKRPQRVDGPRLAPPPPLDESTGQPVPPPVEKTFLQKYWLPMLGIGLFAVSQLAPAEDPRQAAKK